MNIVVLDAFTTNPGDLSWDPVAQLGNAVFYDRTAREDVVSRAIDAEILLTNKVVLDANTLNQLPKLKYVGVLATGYNVVDLKKAAEKGVVVTNIPSYSSESVVQNAFAHLLNLASSYALNVAATRSGEWSQCQDFSFTRGKLTELWQKTIGVVGYGTIGKRVAQVALAFGMKALVYGPRLTPGVELLPGVATATLDELFQKSDVVSLHCPLNESTSKLVNSERLKEMKRGAFLINTGRGGLIDEASVAEALRSGQLGGVGVDVLSTEPPKETNPLLSAPNCYVTPHNAWASLEARRRLVAIAAANIKAFQENKPQNVVNK